MFFKRRMAKRLAQVGSCVDTSFMIYVNNEEPIQFPAMENVLSYLKEYRSNNVISRLQIYRIETYTL